MSDVLIKEAARRRAEREAAEAAETKASWARAASGARSSGHPSGPWARVVASINARNRHRPEDTATGWTKVVAAINRGQGHG